MSVLTQILVADGVLDGALLARLLTDPGVGFEPRTLECDTSPTGAGEHWSSSRAIRSPTGSSTRSRQCRASRPRT